MSCAAGTLALFILAQDPPSGSPFGLEKASYVFRLAENQVGRETVEFRANGWKARGEINLGRTRGEYEVALSREEGALQWSYVGKEEKAELRLEAELRAGMLGVRSPPAEDRVPLDLTGAPSPFFYLNLSWIHFFEPCRALAADAAAGKLAVDTRLTGILPDSKKPASFEMKLVEFSRVDRTVGGRAMTLWNFTLQFADVEMSIVCSPEGLPLRISVPVQRVDVVLEGFEAVDLPGLKPSTIVDAGPWRLQLSKPRHEVTVEKHVVVRMRDGKGLAADVYRPTKEGRYPVILARTPYHRETEGMIRGTFFARRGYVFVAQDVRGRGDSEGEWFPLRNEERDGHDTLVWIAAQPWCDGNVGMIGASYGGWVQWYAAKSGHPALKAICPMVAPPDPDQNFPYKGGCLNLGAGWWAKFLESGGIPHPDWSRALQTLPLSDLDKALDVQHPFLDEWIAHPPSDETYWAPLRYQTHWSRMNVAVLNLSGWFDANQPGATSNFPGMRRNAPEGARRNQHLILGPWLHAFNSSRRIGDVDFGPEAMVDLDSVVLRFFDRYLKGADNGMGREDPVLVFVAGENHWRRAKDWPLPETQFTKLYLRSGGKANRRDGDGRLSAEPPADEPPDTYQYDPIDLPPWIGDHNDLSGAAATADHSGLPEREDILDYTSPPLAAAVDVIGPTTATLAVSTDAADTDFVVEAFVLRPDGKMRIFAAGIQRLRYRHGRDEPVRPGEAVEIRIDCGANGLRLEKGDRIRLQVLSSAFPAYARNLNTLDPPATAGKPRAAANTVYHDAARPSFLVLPIVPGETVGPLRFE